MENQQGDIPVHPDKALFAQDLISYIINDLYRIDYRLDGAERFRGIAYNAFNDTIKAGASKIDEAENGFLPNMVEIRTWDKASYYSFVSRIGENFLGEGLEPRKFLKFCVFVTVLAKEFLTHGLRNAPNLAAIVIYESLVDYDMLSGGWDSLNSAAGSIKNFTDYDGLLSPDTTSTETADSDWHNSLPRSNSSGGTPSISTEKRITDNNDNISPVENNAEAEMCVLNSEHTSMSKEDGNVENYKYPTS